MATAAAKEEVILSIDEQGATPDPSRIKILGKSNGAAITEPFAVRVRVCDEGEFDAATNAEIAVDSGYGTVIATHTTDKDIDVISTSANALGTLTLTGVVSDGETVTIGSRVYEFDTDGETTTGNVAVDISAAVAAAEGTLTVDTQPTALDSMEIDGRGYTFVADGDANAPGEISIGADLGEAQANIVAAINGTDGFNTAHASVTAGDFAADDAVITATVPGAGGNAITTTENFTAGTNVFDAGVLGTTTAGSGAAAGAAITALAAAITGDASAVVTAVDGAGDTLVATAIVSGYAGDAIATTETMANASWASATLAGAAIPSEIFVNITDGTAEIFTVRLGAPEIEGLSAPYHGTSLDVEHVSP